MKYYIIAGEASGDLHASNLIRGLREEDPCAEIRGWGGDLMKEAGCSVVRHYKETAIMGFVAVVRNLGRLKANIRACCDDIAEWRPDVVILLDYAGFNLRIARFAKEAGIRVFYYISPKLWAWNTGRVEKIRRYVDHMYAIFPFEVDFYHRFGYDRVSYAGNPLVDAVATRPMQDETFEQFVKTNGLSGRPLMALVPGSRRQELKYVLPRMMEMVEHFPDFEFVIAGAPSMSEADYASYVGRSGVRVLYGQTYRLVSHARGALVTSGTATLETAMLGTPQVVCYSTEGGRLAYLMFRIFVKVKYISLVNLILGREAVPELLLQKLTKANLLRESRKILYDESVRARMKADSEEINRCLGEVGASRRFARMMVEDLGK